jgi:hypothetical protein
MEPLGTPNSSAKPATLIMVLSFIVITVQLGILGLAKAEHAGGKHAQRKPQTAADQKYKDY